MQIQTWSQNAHCDKKNYYIGDTRPSASFCHIFWRLVDIMPEIKTNGASLKFRGFVEVKTWFSRKIWTWKLVLWLVEMIQINVFGILKRISLTSMYWPTLMQVEALLCYGLSLRKVKSEMSWSNKFRFENICYIWRQRCWYGWNKLWFKMILFYWKDKYVSWQF